ncbi:dihydrodipicolinate synthase family protein [Phytobacter diazotrophicus]|uniref:dihydrodipicolinate synthase family protein n=1 Tax=Phytobacter diazotrophicus TaxID=395631 RepID=UPI00290E743B|nr:dihydrodipicolinate synthase family protein [Phytobacter diazotrophicus]MDU7200676.1 dihydrodipicolinate synthase family protein [Enterobacteriaceae bacterium]MDV2875363.1 dihydrodipicolinate synthase family protein [Phytobacter diazotrophicus]
MLRGLSAFPLTPITNNNVDEAAFVHLITNLVAAGVDSIGAVGSTGSYAYLTRDERRRVAELAVQHAEGVPVLVSIGALRLDDVLAIAEDAQRAGVKAVMMAPVSYQRLTAEEVYTLYETVTRHLSVPLCLYDNPATTGFAFTDDLLVEIAALPAVSSIKLSAVSTDPTKGKERLDDLRARIPASVTIGISGDWQAATGFAAGCDVWYSVIGGLFPQVSLALTRAARAGNHRLAGELSDQLEPLWQLFRIHRSLRVMAAAAEIMGVVGPSCLPFPLRPLAGEDKEHLHAVLKSTGLV